MPAAKSHLVYQIRAIFKILGFQKFKVSAVILYVFSVSSSLEDTLTYSSEKNVCERYRGWRFTGSGRKGTEE